MFKNLDTIENKRYCNFLFGYFVIVKFDFLKTGVTAIH